MPFSLNIAGTIALQSHCVEWAALNSPVAVTRNKVNSRNTGPSLLKPRFDCDFTLKVPGNMKTISSIITHFISVFFSECSQVGSSLGPRRSFKERKRKVVVIEKMLNRTLTAPVALKTTKRRVKRIWLAAAAGVTCNASSVKGKPSQRRKWDDFIFRLKHI